MVVVEEVVISEGYGTFSRPSEGNVYVARVSYESLENGTRYGPLQWSAFADGEAVDQAFVIEGPDPSLNSDALPNGRTASGWIVWEVPNGSSVVLSYKDNYFYDNPDFEVSVPEN